MNIYCQSFTQKKDFPGRQFYKLRGQLGRLFAQFRLDQRELNQLRGEVVDIGQQLLPVDEEDEDNMSEEEEEDLDYHPPAAPSTRVARYGRRKWRRRGNVSFARRGVGRFDKIYRQPSRTLMFWSLLRFVHCQNQFSVDILESFVSSIGNCFKGNPCCVEKLFHIVGIVFLHWNLDVRWAIDSSRFRGMISSSKYWSTY